MRKHPFIAEVAPWIGQKLVLYQEPVIPYIAARKVLIWSVFCNLNIAMQWLKKEMINVGLSPYNQEST